MPGTTGASPIAVSILKKLKGIKRRGDFSVKIIFSSVSMSTLSDWMEEKYVDTKSAYTSVSPVTHLAWSQPEGPGYTADCDETIFVDCSSNQAEYFKDSDGGEDALRSYISFAIARLADIIYRRTEEKQFGIVRCVILAYHPCQKCLFALSELLGNSLAYSGIYGSFVSDILSRDEFHFSLRWMQSLGWQFIVNYCGVFDPYKAEGEDQKGDAERAKELKAILDAYPSEENYANIAGGDLMYDKDSWIHDREKFRKRSDVTERNRTFYINYEGQEYTIEQLREKHRKIVDPTPEEMEANLKEMKKAQKEKEKRANKRKKTINNARKDYAENMARRSDIEEQEINYLVANSKTYSDYGSSAQDLARARARSALNYEGIIPDSMINVPIDGHYTTDIELIAEINRIDDDVAKGKKQIEDYEKAIADKKEAIKSQRIGAIQILVAIASIPFPVLAIVDIALTVYQWDMSKASAKDNVLNAAGIAFDVCGLIPYFGSIFKMARFGSKANVTSLSDDFIGIMNDVQHSKFDIVAVSGGSHKLSSGEVQFIEESRGLFGGPKKGVSGVYSKNVYTDGKVQVVGKGKYSGKYYSYDLNYEEARKLLGEAKDGLRNNTRVESVSINDLNSALHNSGYSGDNPVFDLVTELQKNLSALEGGEKATLTFIRTLTGGESLSAALMKLSPTAIPSNFKNAQSALDHINAVGDLFVRGVGVGYNGWMWIKNNNSKPLTEEEAKKMQEREDAFLKMEQAQKDELEAKMALKEATTDAERAEAQKALEDAETRKDEASKVIGVDYSTPTQTSLNASSIDANAELERAKEDEKKAKRALRKADSPAEREAAQNALDNAQERKDKAQKAVNAQMVSSVEGYSDKSASADQALANWKASANQVNQVAGRPMVINRNPSLIAGNDGLIAGVSPLDAMYISENTKNLNNQYNAANLANTLSPTESDFNNDYYIAKANEDKAYQKAQQEGEEAFQSFMAGVDADIAEQNLRHTLEQQKKEEERQ